MARPRVAFLDASHDDINTPRNFRRELDAELVEFGASEGDIPDTTAYDGAVVTGSRSSVYWDEAWIPSLCETIADFVAAEVPVLGVCFGHQAVAHALGGTVEDMGEYELGYRTVQQVADDVLFRDVPDPFLAFQSHSDTVTELPPEATLLAENEAGVQAFRWGSAVGVQFHPEYDRETAQVVAERKDLPQARIQAVLEGITEEAVARAAKTKALFDGFDETIRAYRAEREVAADD
ncbi:MAG: type 1 glutamine amidotransferase [Halobacteriaceae archaeon]